MTKLYNSKSISDKKSPGSAVQSSQSKSSTSIADNLNKSSHQPSVSNSSALNTSNCIEQNISSFDDLEPYDKRKATPFPKDISAIRNWKPPLPKDLSTIRKYKSSLQN